MKTLITGCAGFAGSHLAEYLLNQNQEVIALVQEGESLANLESVLPGVRVERGDVRDGERILRLLQDIQPHRIYHLAAMSSPVESLGDPKLTYEVNFGGTVNLLCAWRKLEMDCRFLFVSSGDVYGMSFLEKTSLSEEALLQPLNPYAASKVAGELLSFQFYKSYGLPIVRARPFNHTGPRQSPAFVCSSFARQIVEIDLGLRPPVMVVGNLGVRRDFSDVRDIVRGYHLLLEKGNPGEVYQLCSGRAVSIETILRTLRLLTPKPIRIEVDESKVRGQEASVLWGDPTKAKQAVGWSPQIDLETTLRDLTAYWGQIVRSQSNLMSPTTS